MNDYAGESILRDKIKSFQQEGLASQAYYRSGPRKASPLHKLPRMIFSSLILLVLLNWLMH